LNSSQCKEAENCSSMQGRSESLDV